MGEPKRIRRQLKPKTPHRGGKRATVIEFGFEEHNWQPTKVGNCTRLTGALRKARDRFNTRYARGDTMFAVAVELPRDVNGYNRRVLQLTRYRKDVQVDVRIDREPFRYLVQDGWGEWIHE